MTEVMGARLAKVMDRVGRACVAAGRGKDEVRVIAVSKIQPAEAIQEAYALGVRDFGENYVQELAAKRAELPADIRWHFIGRLQSNKAKLLRSGPLSWIHALDSVSQVKALRAAMQRGAPEHAETVDVLIAVNVAAEDTKGGVAPEAVSGLVDAILAAPGSGLRLRGLMTMPPWSDNPNAARPAFAQLRQLLSRLRVQYPEIQAQLTELSMGMSHDLEAAIAEGATMVRVGTAIFGERAR